MIVVITAKFLDIPKKKQLTSGKVVNARLMTTEYVPKDGRLQKKSGWHDVTFFDGLADVVDTFCRKNSLVEVTGSLRYRPFKTSHGDRKHTTEIRAEKLRILNP